MIAWMKKAVKLKGYDASKWTDEHDAVANTFLTVSEARKLIGYMSVEGTFCLAMVSATGAIPVSPKAFVYWARKDAAPLNMTRIRSAVQFGGVASGGESFGSQFTTLHEEVLAFSSGVEALGRLLSAVYLPAAKSTTLWPDRYASLKGTSTCAV
jgi:hypothetical protein